MTTSTQPSYPPRALQKGFTLIEVIVALTIFGLTMVGCLGFLIQSLKSYSYDTSKLFVNRDIRTFTNELTDNATYANYFLIFPSFSGARSSTDSTTGVTSDTSVNDGLSGDLLVLVYKDDTTNSDGTTNDTKVSRLIGYYRYADPTSPADNSGQGPVRTFDIKISPSSSAPVWSLLPDVSTMKTNPLVLQLSVGLADQKLFYNYYDRSIMVKGQIFHAGILTKDATNIYNFTVSPRG